jgi:DNA (cytosine-5)-methyltransferase 1
MYIQKLGIIDLFCGTGGFSLGFEHTGDFSVLGGIDILDTSVQTFSANHYNARAIIGDIQKTTPEAYSASTGISPENVDVIIGGPPCQGFSSIRPFRSLDDDDPRNNLYESFATYVRFFKPQVFVMENVIGLVTHNRGKTIEDIVKAFTEMGYTTDWRVLNAVHYGVPQRRERVIMIGRKGGHAPIFPSPEYFFDQRGMMVQSHPKVIRTLPMFEGELPAALSVLHAINDLPILESGQKSEHYRNDIVPNEYQLVMRNNADKLTLHESTLHSPKMLEVIRHSGTNINALPPGMVTSGFSTSYSRLEGHEPAVTLTVNFVHPGSNKCIHPLQNRALTPREGARLQSFDDQFNFLGNRAQIVKQIGNAVPPLLGRAIARSVLQNWG